MFCRRPCFALSAAAMAATILLSLRPAPAAAIHLDLVRAVVRSRARLDYGVLGIIVVSVATTGQAVGLLRRNHRRGLALLTASEEFLGRLRN